MTEPLPIRCLLHQVLYHGISPYGDPYAVLQMGTSKNPNRRDFSINSAIMR
jgi:hypothetical protein